MNPLPIKMRPSEYFARQIFVTFSRVPIPLKSPSIPKQIDTHTGANRQCEKSERSDAGNLFIA
jgi:hypothetical protein